MPYNKKHFSILANWQNDDGVVPFSGITEPSLVGPPGITR